jgi:hypothetical protein
MHRSILKNRAFHRPQQSMYPAQNTVISESYDNLGRGSTKNAAHSPRGVGQAQKGSLEAAGSSPNGKQIVESQYPDHDRS